jgi:hypothetical protein
VSRTSKKFFDYIDQEEESTKAALPSRGSYVRLLRLLELYKMVIRNAISGTAGRTPPPSV